MADRQPLPHDDPRPVPDEPDSEPEFNEQGENVVAYLLCQPDWADTLLQVVTSHPFVMAKNQAGKTWHVLPTGEPLGQECDAVPMEEDFPLRIITDVRSPLLPLQPQQQEQVEEQVHVPDSVLDYVKPNPVPNNPVTGITVEFVKPSNDTNDQTDELMSATSPPQVFGSPANNQGHARPKPSSKTQAAPPKAARTTISKTPPVYATPIENGQINFIVYPHAGFLSADDWQARAQAVKAVADCPTISVRSYFPNELIIRAVGSPRIDLPQPCPTRGFQISRDRRHGEASLHIDSGETGTPACSHRLGDCVHARMQP